MFISPFPWATEPPNGGSRSHHSQRAVVLPTGVGANQKQTTGSTLTVVPMHATAHRSIARVAHCFTGVNHDELHDT